MALSSVPFWNELLVTGTYYWVVSNGPASYSRWINLSFSVVQTFSGVIMAGVLSFAMCRGLKELLNSTPSNRVKLYFVLSLLGTIINLYNGIASVLDETFTSRSSRELIMIGWSLKYVHISLDTMVFLILLGRGAVKLQDSRVSSGSGGNSGTSIIPHQPYSRFPHTSSA
ncbi:unnamed protein product [Choristocarpus tenellus]